MDSTLDILSSEEWEKEDYYLSEFTNKFHLPQVVKITKGQYMNVGVPSSSDQSLSKMALLTQAVKRYKVVAQCVKFRDRKPVIPIGHKLSIPETFNGWFETLSDDGHEVKCIENVGDLLMIPCSMFLVRENIKVHLAEKENPSVISDETRTVHEGETLALANEFFVNAVKSNSSGHYLRCLTAKGEAIFLSVYEKGKFSPIGGEDEISGLHTIKQLILSKRFPLMVRLVYGKPPDGLGIGSEFSMEMRLYSLYIEESIMTLPLMNSSELVALPPLEPLKVQVPRDPEKLVQSQIFRTLLQKSETLYQESCDKIQIFNESLCKDNHNVNFEVTKDVKIQSWDSKIKIVSGPKSKYGDHSENEEKQMAKNDTENNSNATGINYDQTDENFNYKRGNKHSSKDEIKHNRSSTANNLQLNTNSRVLRSADNPELLPIETTLVGRNVKEDNKILTSGKGSNITNENTENVNGHIYGTPKNNLSEKHSEIPIANEGKKFICNAENHVVNKILNPIPAESRMHQKSKILNPSPTPQDEPIRNQRDICDKFNAAAPKSNTRYKSLYDLDKEADGSEIRNIRFSGGNKGRKRHESIFNIFGIDHLCKSRDTDEITYNSSMHQKSKILNPSPTPQNKPIRNQRDIHNKSNAAGPKSNTRYKSLYDLAKDTDSSENRNIRFSGGNKGRKRHESIFNIFGVDNFCGSADSDNFTLESSVHQK